MLRQGFTYLYSLGVYEYFITKQETRKCFISIKIIIMKFNLIWNEIKLMRAYDKRKGN